MYIYSPCICIYIYTYIPSSIALKLLLLLRSFDFCPIAIQADIASLTGAKSFGKSASDGFADWPATTRKDRVLLNTSSKAFPCFVFVFINCFCCCFYYCLYYCNYLRLVHTI